MTGPPRPSFHQELAIKAALQSSAGMFRRRRHRPTFRRMRGITGEQAVFLHIAFPCLPEGEIFTSMYIAEGSWRPLMMSAGR